MQQGNQMEFHIILVVPLGADDEFIWVNDIIYSSFSTDYIKDISSSVQRWMLVLGRNPASFVTVV